MGQLLLYNLAFTGLIVTSNETQEHLEAFGAVS